MWGDKDKKMTLALGAVSVELAVLLSSEGVCSMISDQAQEKICLLHRWIFLILWGVPLCLKKEILDQGLHFRCIFLTLWAHTMEYLENKNDDFEPEPIFYGKPAHMGFDVLLVTCVVEKVYYSVAYFAENCSWVHAFRKTQFKGKKECFQGNR